MTREDREYNELLLSMFGTPAWGLFIETAQEMLDAAIEHADTECETNTEWQFRRGNIQTLRWLTNCEKVTIAVLENADA